MWIESVQIDKFGKLRNFCMDFEQGLIIVSGCNESGKTTLLAFIRAMLYGLNGRSNSISQNDRRKYMPWGETSMGGSLRLTNGQITWEISRVFGQAKRYDTCRLTDAASGESIGIPAGEEPGQVLLGIDEEVFDNTLFVSSRGSRLEGDGATLGEKIKNLIGTGVEDVDLSKVLERLRSARNQITPRTRDKGSLNAVRNELADVRMRLMESEKQEERVRALRKRVEELSAIVSDDRTERLRQRLAEKEQIDQRLQAYRQQMAVLAADMAEQQAQKPSAEPDKRGRHGILHWLWLALAVLTAAGSVAAGLLVSNYCYLGLIVTTGLSVLYMRQKDQYELKQVRTSGSQVQENEIGRKLAAAQRELAMYAQQCRRLEQQMQVMQQEIGYALKNDDPAKRDQLVAARVELETLLRSREEPGTLRQRQKELEQKESRLMRRVEALEMAERELMLAARERQSDFVPALTARMEEMLAQMTAGKYVRAVLSQGMELSLQPDNGALQPWEYFSGGTIELMYLALRMSLIQLLQKHAGSLPTFLDDPFVLFDDKRAQTGMELLGRGADQGQQIILFTCQGRTAQMSQGARLRTLAK